MLSLTLKESELSSVLERLLAEETLQLLANTAAQSYVDDTKSFIDQGESFTSKTGALEDSIGWRDNGDHSATVFAAARYAGYIEFGTSFRDATPFFFADQENLLNNIELKVVSVLESFRN